MFYLKQIVFAEFLQTARTYAILCDGAFEPVPDCIVRVTYERGSNVGPGHSLRNCWPTALGLAVRQICTIHWYWSFRGEKEKKKRQEKKWRTGTRNFAPSRRHAVRHMGCVKARNYSCLAKESIGRSRSLYMYVCMRECMNMCVCVWACMYISADQSTSFWKPLWERHAMVARIVLVKETSPPLLISGPESRS